MTSVAPATGGRPAVRGAPPSARRTTSGSSTCEQGVEVAGPRGRQEGVDDRALAGRGRRPAAAGARGPAGGPGWRAAGPRRATGRRSARSRRTARRTCRAARRRAARPGVSVSSTTSSASPTESASSASCSGSTASSAARRRLGQPGAGELLAAGSAGPQHVEADAADDGGQPAAEVVDRAGVACGSAAARPPAPRPRPRRASRASGRPPPAGAAGAPRIAPRAVALDQGPSHRLLAIRHPHDEPKPADVTGPRRSPEGAVRK